MNEHDQDEAELLDEHELFEALRPLAPDPKTFEEGVQNQLAEARAVPATAPEAAPAVASMGPTKGRWMRRAAMIVPPGILEASWGVKALSGAAGKGGVAAGGATFGVAVAGLVSALGLFFLGLFGIRRAKTWPQRNGTLPDGRPDFFFENLVIGGLITAGFLLFYFLRYEITWITLAGTGVFLLLSMVIAIGMIERKGPLPRSIAVKELVGVLTNPFVLFLMASNSPSVTALPASLLAVGILAVGLTGPGWRERKFAISYPLVGLLLLTFVRSPLVLDHDRRLLGATSDEFVTWANEVDLEESPHQTWEQLGWLTEMLDPRDLTRIDRARLARAIAEDPEPVNDDVADSAADLEIRQLTTGERAKRQNRHPQSLPDLERDFALLSVASRLRMAERLGETDWIEDAAPELEDLLRRTWDSDGSIGYTSGGFFSGTNDKDYPYVGAGLAAVSIIAMREREAPGVLDRTGISLVKLQRYFREEAIGSRELIRERSHFKGAIAYYWLRQTFDLPLKPTRERLAFVFINLVVLVSVALSFRAALRSPSSIAQGPKGGK